MGLARREGQSRHRADHQLRHVPRIERERAVFLQRTGQILRRREDRAGSVGGVRRAEGDGAGDGREVVGAEFGGVSKLVEFIYYEAKSKTANR